METTSTVKESTKWWSSLPQSTEWSQVGLVAFSAPNLAIRTTKMRMEAHKPNLPMSSAITSSLFCRGVDVSYYCSRRALIFPRQELSPTTITIIFPYPVSILVPESMIGVGTSWIPAEFFYPFLIISFIFSMHWLIVFFLIGLVYPVIAL